MASPLVSIIIPCFNQGKFLAEAIDSALAQTYRNIEIVVINSGSTDTTAEVMARYTGRIRAIIVENRGVSRARNVGITESAGELIALLDADDRWLPDKLDHQVPRLMASADVALLCSAYRSFTADGQSREVTVEDGFRPTLHQQMVFNHMNAQTALFRRSVLRTVGMFDETLQRCEDWDLWNRIVARAPIMGTSRVVAEYRRHPGTLSTDARQMLHASLQVLRKSRSLHGKCADCDRAYCRGIREARAVYAAARCSESTAQFRAGRFIAAARSRLAGLWQNPRSPLDGIVKRMRTT